MRTVLVLVVALSMLEAQAGTGTVPASVNVQGVLRDGVGGLESGSFQFAINVYSAQTGGVPLWTQTQSSIAVESGFFSLTLTAADGAGGETIASLIESTPSPLFVGVTLQGDASELPRIALASVPYAFVADHATSVDNFGTVSSTAVNHLFSATCAAGTYAVGVNSDGSLNCTTPAGTAYTGDATTIAVSGTHVISAAGNLATIAGLSVSALSTAAADASALDTIAGDTPQLVALSTAQTQCNASFVKGIDGAGTFQCGTAYTGDGTSVSVSATNVIGLASTVSSATTFSGTPTFSNGATFSGGTASFNGTTNITNGATVNKALAVSGTGSSLTTSAATTLAVSGPLTLSGSSAVVTATAAAGSAVDLSAGTVALPLTTVVAAGSSSTTSAATVACPSTSYFAIGGGCSASAAFIAATTASALTSCPSNGATATTAAACVSGTAPATTSWSCAAKSTAAYVMTAYVICLKQH